MSRRIREVLVGLFVLGGIAVAIWAFFWFSGRIVHGNRRLVTVYFRDAAGLKTGDPVAALGIDKGRVVSMALDGDRVRTTVAVDRDLKLTRESRIAIRSVSYLGSDRYLMVVPGPDTGAAVDTLAGENEALDLEEIFLKLDRMLADLDLGDLTSQLKGLRDELMQTVKSELGQFNSNFADATAELVRLSARLDTLVQSVDKQSTAGKLVSSSELYDELRQTNSEVQALVKDIKEHPDKYVRVKFSLFK